MGHAHANQKRERERKREKSEKEAVAGLKRLVDLPKKLHEYKVVPDVEYARLRAFGKRIYQVIVTRKYLFFFCTACC